MDVSVVREYLETKKNRQKLESRFKKLDAELSIARAEEAELSSKVDLDGLITAESVKVINALLEEHRPLWLNGFPVSFAHAALKNGKLRLSVIFAQPLFSGWRTETIYYSRQSCPLSLETPEPPSENHIPLYTQVVDWAFDVICWEQRNGGQGASELRLWTDDRRGILFHWSKGGDANQAETK